MVKLKRNAIECNYYISNIMYVADRDSHTISSNLMHHVHIFENYVSSEMVMSNC
jgi:hypothetical protein